MFGVAESALALALFRKNRDAYSLPPTAISVTMR
jgi:hypothetical protein